MCFSVGVGRNALPWFQPSASGKEIVLRPFPRPLPAHSIRWRALPQMRQNGLDRVRIGDICDHPQGAAAQRTDRNIDKIGPGSRYQRCQPGEKVRGSEQNVSGTIAERMLEFVARLAGSVGRQPLQTDGGPRDATTQVFKAISLVWPVGNSFSGKPFLSTVKGFGWVSERCRPGFFKVSVLLPAPGPTATR